MAEFSDSVFYVICNFNKGLNIKSKKLVTGSMIQFLLTSQQDLHCIRGRTGACMGVGVFCVCSYIYGFKR